MEPPARGDEGDDGPGFLKGALSASMRLASMRRGLRSKFGPLRTASRRVRERGRHDAPRRSTSNLYEPSRTGSGRSSCRPARARRPFPSISQLEVRVDLSRRFHALANTGSTTFTKIANKWNTALIGADSVFDIELELVLVEALASS